MPGWVRRKFRGQLRGSAGAGTEKAADAGNPEGGKDTIKIAVYSDFAGFDPYNSGMDLDKVVYSNIFDCLLRYYDGKYENVIVQGITASARTAQSIPST